MSWWIYLIVVAVLLIFYAFFKNSKIGWLAKLAESSAYIAEQMGQLKDLKGEAKMEFAVQMMKELAKQWGVSWVLKFVPDDVLVNFIEAVVGKINWSKPKVLSQEEFVKQIESKTLNNNKIKIDTEIQK